MSDFWWGVLALPLILVAIATAVAIVLGAWLLMERWSERRTGEMNYDGDEYEPIYRRRPATWILVAPRLRRLKLGFGCSLIYVRGLNRVSKKRFHAAEAAVNDALQSLR